MSVIPMMELIAKAPVLWDLESLVMLSTKNEQTPKTLQLVDSEIEGIEGFEVGSFYSSGGRSDGGTGSDLGYSSSWRSSKSASDDSSPDKEIKETHFSLEVNDCFQQDLTRKGDLVTFEPTRTSPTIESAVASGESLTALGLCNRTYLEDISGASIVKKPKSSSRSLDISCCQVEGCDIDLSLAKDYHRKHKVCESHSKSSRVIIKGHERRFCQQCSRFHAISEFDQKKRSCRRRLSDHNARRRKPKLEVIHFNSMKLASSLYEGRNQLNFAFDQSPVVQTRNGEWEGTMATKPTLAKPILFSSEVSSVSNHLLPSKGTPPEVYPPGLPSYTEAAHEFRALSLLSKGSWGSYDPNPSSLDQSMPLPAMDKVSLGGPPVSSEFWTAGSHTPSFQLFKAPNESNFYLY